MRGVRVVFPERERVAVEEFEIPRVGPNQLLIRTEVSLISAGTELTGLLGGHGIERYPGYPGYSNVGIVEEVGPGVTDFQPGQRLLTHSHHASHAVLDLSPDAKSRRGTFEVVPEGVRPEDATFATLGSVAMHGVRKAMPRLRESAAVVGQGVVGQLVAQLARISSCSPVIGIDVFPSRLEKARQSGTHVVINAGEQDVDAAVKEATGGKGVNLAFDATRNPQTLLTLMQIAALNGKVIIVGSIPGKAEIPLFDPLQTKELTIIGAWNPRAPDYDIHPYVPWSHSLNYRAFLDLIKDGLIRVDHLITHRPAPQEAPGIYDMIRRSGSDWLGIVFQW